MLSTDKCPRTFTNGAGLREFCAALGRSGARYETRRLGDGAGASSNKAAGAQSVASHRSNITVMSPGSAAMTTEEADILAKCPKDIEGKARYWILQNPLGRHLVEAKLKNCYKEANALLKKIEGT